MQLGLEGNESVKIHGGHQIHIPPWKFNSKFAPENKPSGKERIIFQSHHFSGASG